MLPVIAKGPMSHIHGKKMKKESRKKIRQPKEKMVEFYSSLKDIVRLTAQDGE